MMMLLIITIIIIIIIVSITFFTIESDWFVTVSNLLLMLLHIIIATSKLLDLTCPRYQEHVICQVKSNRYTANENQVANVTSQCKAYWWRYTAARVPYLFD